MRFVAGGDVHRVGVRVRIYRHGGNRHAPRGPRDAASNLAAIGDEDLVKHRLVSATRARRAKPGARTSAAAFRRSRARIATASAATTPSARAATQGRPGTRSGAPARDK